MAFKSVLTFQNGRKDSPVKLHPYFTMLRQAQVRPSLWCPDRHPLTPAFAGAGELRTGVLASALEQRFEVGTHK